MRSSSQKDLAVFDYDKDEEDVEEASNRYVARIQSKLNSNPQEPVDKYTFLQFFDASRLNIKEADSTNISCIDLHENESPQVSFAIDSPERNLASIEEKSELDDIMASSASYEERVRMHLDELDPETLARTNHPATGACSPAVPSVRSRQVSELQSDGMPVDVISDEEQSWTSLSRSPSTSASDLVEDEGYAEDPILDNCYSAFGEMDDNDISVTLCPDYVIYGNTLYEESQLTFFSDYITVQCFDTNGNEERFSLKWAITDIVHIDCQWSRSVEAALVKFHLRATTSTRIVGKHDNCDLKLIFAVTDLHWLEKEQKIKSLAARYEDIWKAHLDGGLASEDGFLGPSIYFPKRYFSEIPDSFDDVIYPKGDPDAVSISKREIELLQPDTFINDTIIDFYIKYLKTKIQPNEKHRFHFFNSFFFRKLADLDKDPGSTAEGRAAFQRVRKWTRKVNIFEKDYIFIPVNFNLHWSLLVICHLGEVATLKEDGIKDSPKVPCILHMDSIKGSHSGLKNLVQSYLWEEWKERHPKSAEDNSSKFSNLRFVPLELPQQENLFDCGLFLLHYVELFLEEAPVNFNPFKITKLSGFLTVDWFSPAEASFKRSLIRKLIYELLNDPSQKITPNCSNGHLSPGYREKDTEQEPAIEFLSERCSPSKTVVGNSACCVTDAEIETNLLNTSSVGVANCGKQEGFIMREFLESDATATPAQGDNPFQQNSSSQNPKCETCPTEVPLFSSMEHEGTSEQVVSSSLDEDDCQPVGARARATAQICSTSYSLKDVGPSEMSRNPLQGKEEGGANSMPEILKNDQNCVSNQNVETEKPEPILLGDGTYVPESPTLSSGEKGDGFVEDSQEIDTKAEECGDCECLGLGTTEANSGCGGECVGMSSAESNSGFVEDSQKIDTKAECGYCECPGLGTTEANSCGGECVGISKAEAEAGDSGDCQKINIAKPDIEKDEDCQEIGTTREEALDCEECQIIDSATEAEGGHGEVCQGIETTTEAVTGSSGGPSHESCLPRSSSHNIVIDDDENSSDKDVLQLERDEPSGMKFEQHYHKRRRVLEPEGGRRRTRSFTRDCIS